MPLRHVCHPERWPQSARKLMDFLGLRYIWLKFFPGRDLPGLAPQPATGVLWFLTINTALFGLASQRYESDLDQIENRQNGLLAASSIAALERVPEAQKLARAQKPQLLYLPATIRSLFGAKVPDADNVRVLAEVVESYKHLFTATDAGAGGDRPRRLPGLDWRDIRLAGVDLSGWNLRKADLQGATLSGANLEGAMLQGARLQRADLRGASLSGANLFHARLNEAQLAPVRCLPSDDADGSHARHVPAGLVDANLQNADLTRANLCNASLSGASLSGAILADTNLSGADLRPMFETPTVISQYQLDAACAAPELPPLLPKGLHPPHRSCASDCTLPREDDGSLCAR